MTVNGQLAVDFDRLIASAQGEAAGPVHRDENYKAVTFGFNGTGTERREGTASSKRERDRHPRRREEGTRSPMKTSPETMKILVSELDYQSVSLSRPRAARPFDGEGGGGDGGDGGGGGGNATDTGGAGGGGGGEKSLPQSEVNALVSKAKNEATAKAKKELAESLGVTLEEAGEIVKSAKERDDKQKSEAEKAAEAAKAATAKAESDSSEASKKSLELDVIRALARAGVPLIAAKEDDQAVVDEKLSKMVRLVDVEPGADASAIDVAVKSLKTTMPELFGAAAGGQKTPSTDPKTPKGGGKPPVEDAMKRGAERAKARNDSNRYSWEAPAESGAK